MIAWMARAGAERAMQAIRYLSFETRGMHQAAYVLAAFALASQLLALVRDRLLAAVFGAGHTLDLYYAAFRVPDFLFATVASLFSLYALLPILSKLEAENPDLMISFLRRTLATFFLGMACIAAIAYLFVPTIAPLIAPGLAADPASRAELILLMRLLLLQPILLGASNTIAALTQLRHRFILYSVSPLLYNLGIILGAVVFYPILGIAGLGVGVVLGAALHMLVQVPYFFAERTSVSMAFDRLMQGVKEVLTLSVPRTLALASTQISLLVLTAMASYLANGSITIFTFAFNLQAVPLTVIGVSYSVAAFPTLARLHAQGARDEFARYIEAAMRHILFWSIPATLFVIVLRAQIVRTILGAGAFDWTATRLTAAALALFILSLAAQSVTLLIMRAYYAAGETRKPFFRGVIDIIVSVGSALLLVALFEASPLVRAIFESLLRVSNTPGTPVLMLALGYTMGAFAQCIFGIMTFSRDFGVSFAGLPRLAFETLSASVIGASVSYLVLAFFGSLFNINKTLGVFSEAACAGVLGLAVTALVLGLLGSRELGETVGVVLRRIRPAAQVVALEPSDIA